MIKIEPYRKYRAFNIVREKLFIYIVAIKIKPVPIKETIILYVLFLNPIPALNKTTTARTKPIEAAIILCIPSLEVLRSLFKCGW